MSIEVMKLAAEFNRYFTSGNGVDVPARVSVSRDEWRALFDAIQQTEAQQPATAIACGIPGMVKTTCPYCGQGFAFEHEQPATGEPVGQVFYAADGGDDETGAGYYMKACVHWFGKAPAADTKLYTDPAPSVPAC